MATPIIRAFNNLDGQPKTICALDQQNKQLAKGIVSKHA